MLNYYKILELPENAGADEIDQSYQRLAARYNPETHANPVFAKEKLEEITLAYKSLSNEVSKSWYDMRSEKLVPPPVAQTVLIHNPPIPPKPQLTKEDLRDAEKIEIARKYDNAGNNVSVGMQIFIWFGLLFLAAYTFFYNYSALKFIKYSELYILLSVLLSGVSLHRLSNLLYLQAVYNKEFRPDARLSEEEIPFILLLLFIACIALFWGTHYYYKKMKEEITWSVRDIRFKDFNHKILYTMEDDYGTHRRVVSYETLTYKGHIDSLRIHYYPENADRSEIIGVWNDGIYTSCKEKYQEKETD